MQRVTKKSVVANPPSKPTTAEMPDIASVQVSNIQGNPARGLTDAQVDTRQAAMRAVAGVGFAMAVIGRLLGVVAVG